MCSRHCWSKVQGGRDEHWSRPRTITDLVENREPGTEPVSVRVPARFDSVPVVIQIYISYFLVDIRLYCWMYETLHFSTHSQSCLYQPRDFHFVQLNIMIEASLCHYLKPRNKVWLCINQHGIVLGTIIGRLETWPSD